MLRSILAIVFGLAVFGMFTTLAAYGRVVWFVLLGPRMTPDDLPFAVVSLVISSVLGVFTTYRISRSIGLAAIVSLITLAFSGFSSWAVYLISIGQ